MRHCRRVYGETSSSATASRSGSAVGLWAAARSATAFGIAVALGRTHPPYDNFVTTTKEVKDGTEGYGPVRIFRRGDVNADGFITGADNSALRYYLVNGGVAYPWMDCNDDGAITGGWKADLGTAPATIGGDYRIAEVGSGCTYSCTVDVKVKVPFIGGKIEEQVRGYLDRLITKEQEFLADWMSQH